MITKCYSEYQKEVLDLSEVFRKTISDIPNEYIPIFKKNFSEKDENALNAQINNIKNGKFTLMVVGESKSGKSTFINAFLNTDILPVDVLQCTSAIIEIRHADTPSLTYRTLDDNSDKEISGDKNIKDFLNSHAQIEDKYRAIPVALLDQKIIKYRHQETIRPFNYNGICQDLIKAGENVQNLPEEEFKSRIKEYVDQRLKGTWRDMIVHILIHYPLPPKMRDVRIIDSPGVNAYGQVGELTEKHITEANAVVFIKSLTGSALESKSFIQFLTSKNGGRCKEALFLLLSRVSDLNNTELTKILVDAHRLYDSQIAKEKILPIDSKIQIYYNKLAQKSIEEIDEIMDAEGASGQNFPWIGNLLYKRHRGKITNDKFDQLMCETAGFKNVQRCFEEYARQAQKIALYDLCENISKHYSKIIAELKQGEELKQKQLKKSPEEYEFEIKEQQRRLENLHSQLNYDIYAIKAQYTQKGGEIEQKKSSALTEIRKILNDPSLNFNELQGQVTMCTDSLKNYANEIVQKFIRECNAQLSTKCNENDLGQFMADIIVPNISKEEIDEILKDAEDQSTEEIIKGKTFKETERRLDNDRFKKTTVDSILERLDDIAANLESSLKALFENIAAKYSSGLESNIEQEQELLRNTIKQKADAKELNREIKSINETIDKIEKQSKSIETQKQDLANGLKIS